MKIEVEFDEAVLVTIVQRIAARAFNTNDYRGGQAVEMIETQTLEAIGKLDFGPYIQEAITSEIAPTVRDVVREQIKREAKTAVKAELAKQRTLEVEP